MRHAWTLLLFNLMVWAGSRLFDAVIVHRTMDDMVDKVAFSNQGREIGDAR